MSPETIYPNRNMELPHHPELPAEATRILIVEDELILAQDMKDRLGQLGYTVTGIVRTGEDAVARARKDPPDIILMDIMLAGRMDGIEAAAAIRAIADVPVIYLTAYADKEIVARAKATEPYGYLIKPFDDREIQTTIQIAWYKHGMDRKLRESEFKYRTLVENIPEKIFVKDTTSTYISCNESYAREMGISPDSIAGKTDFDFYPEELAKKYRTDDRRIMESGVAKACEEPYVAEGKEYWVSTIKTPVRDNAGKVTGILGIFRDITDRKNAEEALKRARDELEQRVVERTSELRKSEQQYRRLISTLNEGIWVVDRNGITTFVNDRMAGMLGYTGEEMIGRYLFTFMDEQGAAIVRQKIEARTQGIHETYEIEFIRRDGTRIYTVVEAGSLFDEQGTYDGIIAGIIDISQRKLAEEALKNANKKLNLLSSITRHDVLNQITALFLQLEAAKDHINEPGCADIIRQIQRTGENIQRQITFSSDYQDIGVNTPLWQEVDTIVRDTAGEIDAGSTAVIIDLEPLEIYADPLLPKVFSNLIDNALRHAETLSEIRFRCEQCRGGIAIICEDDGVGIPAHVKKGIFNREYFKNTGFGLYLCREILAITGLSIEENGEEGTGARFGITVPDGLYRTPKAR